MTAANGTVRRRSRRRPSFDLSINSSMRHVPSESSESGDDGGCWSDGAAGTGADSLHPLLPGSKRAQQQQQQRQPGLQTAAPPGGASAGRRPGAQPERRQQQHDRGHITVQEWGNMALLVLLYAMQGVPLGLTMGAM
jgi:hypothetical protein